MDRTVERASRHCAFRRGEGDGNHKLTTLPVGSHISRGNVSLLWSVIQAPTPRPPSGNSPLAPQLALLAQSGFDFPLSLLFSPSLYSATPTSRLYVCSSLRASWSSANPSLRPSPGPSPRPAAARRTLLVSGFLVIQAAWLQFLCVLVLLPPFLPL